jgi:hypothetical protein
VDPIGMVFNEFMDATLWHSQRSAHRQCAIRLNDERDCPSGGMNDFVDQDGVLHGQ